MGIAIVLRDQDFSDSPLGQVTFKKSASEKAADYLAAYKTVIGTSDYDDALTDMYIELIYNGLDEKIHGLWPMLGTTLNSLKSNALNPGTFDLCLGANASAGNNKIDFVQSLGVGDMKASATFLEDKSTSFVQITVAQSTGSQLQNTSCLSFQTNVNVSSLDATGLNIETTPVSGDRNWCILPHTGSLSRVYRPITLNEIIKVYEILDSAGVIGSFNNETPVIQEYNFSSRLINPNNTLGFNLYYSGDTGESGAETTTSAQRGYLFGGSAYFHVVGDMSAAEFEQLKQIVNTFLAKVKNI